MKWKKEGELSMGPRLTSILEMQLVDLGNVRLCNLTLICHRDLV